MTWCVVYFYSMLDLLRRYLPKHAPTGVGHSWSTRAAILTGRVRRQQRRLARLEQQFQALQAAQAQLLERHNRLQRELRHGQRGPVSGRLPSALKVPEQVQQPDTPTGVSLEAMFDGRFGALKGNIDG